MWSERIVRLSESLREDRNLGDRKARVRDRAKVQMIEVARIVDRMICDVRMETVKIERVKVRRFLQLSKDQVVSAVADLLVVHGGLAASFVDFKRLAIRPLRWGLDSFQ